MKWRPVTFLAIALLGATACSRSRSPGAAAHDQPSSVTATPAAARDLAKADWDKLQGAWRIESSVWNGVPDPDVFKSVTIIFQGDKFIVVDRDGNRQEETIKLIPEQTPKAIDSWSKGAGQAAPGIYSFEGDTFKWCSAGWNNKVRPTSFASQPGSKQSLMVLRRKKS